MKRGSTELKTLVVPNLEKYQLSAIYALECTVLRGWSQSPRVIVSSCKHAGNGSLGPVWLASSNRRYGGRDGRCRLAADWPPAGKSSTFSSGCDRCALRRRRSRGGVAGGGIAGGGLGVRHFTCLDFHSLPQLVSIVSLSVALWSL